MKLRSIPIADARLRAFLVLLVPCFVGHALQLTGEDVPWSEQALRRYWVTPGWHLALPPLVPLAIAVGLVVAVVVLAVRRSRGAFLTLATLYVLHYFTYPWRIRNHMSTMLAGLVVVSLVWLVARASGALSGSEPRPRLVDRWAVLGLAAVICVTYSFAGLHKMNAGFVDPIISPVTEPLRTFWVYGHLGDVPPRWAIATATWGTIAMELCMPWIAWRWRRVTFAGIGALMLFHVPQVASMEVADYPMIASTFYVALLTRGQMRVLSRHLGVSRWTMIGALLGIATQLWFMPYWSRLMTFGIFVLALWGWAGGAMLKCVVAARRRRRAPLARGTR